MNKKLKDALKLIQNECTKHKSCKDCPLSYEDWHNYICLMKYRVPYKWELD